MWFNMICKAVHRICISIFYFLTGYHGKSLPGWFTLYKYICDKNEIKWLDELFETSILKVSRTFRLPKGPVTKWHHQYIEKAFHHILFSLSASFKVFYESEGKIYKVIKIYIVGTLGCAFIDTESHENGVTKYTTCEVSNVFGVIGHTAKYSCFYHSCYVEAVQKYSFMWWNVYLS